MQETGGSRGVFNPWVRKIPWRKKWQPTPLFLPGNPTDREACGLQSKGLQRFRHDLGTKRHPKRILFYPLLSSPLYKNNSCFLLKYHPLGEVKSHATLAINAFFFLINKWKQFFWLRLPNEELTLNFWMLIMFSIYCWKQYIVQLSNDLQVAKQVIFFFFLFSILSHFFSNEYMLPLREKW